MSKKVKLPLGRNEYVEVDADRILCNDVVLPGEYNPHQRRLWVASSAHGPMGAVWADSIEDALNELVDADLGAAVLVDAEHLASLSEEEQERLAYLGNAGEAADLTDAAVAPVVFNSAKDWQLLCAFAEARGAGADRLGDL